MGSTGGRGLRDLFRFNRLEMAFLIAVYAVGVALRLIPKLSVDPHLPAFMADVWYRICMAQYVLDHWALPEPDIRYAPYGYVPMWYPPGSPFLLALAARLTGLDIPTVVTRLVPFVEALSPLSLYVLGREMYDRWVGAAATLILALTPNFVYFTGIADPQSLTMFMIPLLLAMWYRHASEPSRRNVLLVGLLMGLNFLFHLSYFLEALDLIVFSLGLYLQGRAGRWIFRDLLAVIGLSQLIAAPWWLPRNLYWWWIKALTTSSGLLPPEEQIALYGPFAAAIGIAGALLLLERWRDHLPILLWIVPNAIEAENEVILSALGAIHLSWSTLAKPLEGYRFFPFLAQPLALAAGAALFWGFSRASKRRRLLALGLILVGAGADLALYDLGVKITNAGMTVDEYEAAVWFREHTGEWARISADYYRAQMFAGVCGGRALLGGAFPLRNVDYPYIKAPGRVQDDLYRMYSTCDAAEAWAIARRYNLTHIYYSDMMIWYGNMISSLNGYRFGVEICEDKFLKSPYFRVVYEKDTPSGRVVIVEVVGATPSSGS